MLFKVINETNKFPPNARSSSSNDERFEKWKKYNTDFIKSMNLVDDADIFKIYASAINISQWPALKLSEVQDSQQLFKDHYADLSANNSFYNELVVPWLDFKNKVNSVNGALANPLAANNLALRLVHRYDNINKNWYLTVQLCEIGTVPTATYTRQIYNKYSLTPKDGYFDINLSTVSNYNNDLDGTEVYRHSDVYFSNVKLDGSAISATNDLNTKSVTMAWNEFLELFNDNKSANGGVDSDYKIAFTSGSFVFTPSYDAPIVNPHCVLVYMKFNNNSCLANDGYVIGDFTGKAADLNTICPLRCQEIAIPIGHFPGRP